MQRLKRLALLVLPLALLLVCASTASAGEDDGGMFVDALRSVISWFWESLTSLFEATFAAVVDAIASMFEVCGVDFTPYRSYFEAANFWLPVGEVLVIFAAYITFRISCATVKFIVKICWLGVA